MLLRYIGRHYPEALIVHTHALDAAHHTGDRATEARTLSNLGIVHWLQGHCEQAADHHQQALTLSREADQASHHCHQALTHYTDLGVPDADDVRTHLTALNQT